MNRNQLKKDLDRLHELKVDIGAKTYGESSKAKYAMNNLTRKITETVSFLQNIDLPDSLNEARSKAMALIETAFKAINQNYSSEKLDSRGHEVVSPETDRQSEIIRSALGEFDSTVSKWLMG